MEVMKINERSSKARSTRKSRSIEGGRKAKPARAAGSLRPAKPRRVARVVKGHAAALPVPANDTLPIAEETLSIDAAAGREVEVGIDEIEAEAAESAAGTGLEAEAEAPESALAEGDGRESDEDEEDDVEEEVAAAGAEGQAEGKKRRADDEPASFLAMYFRDMAELDVLRPEQEFETARNIEQLELDLWRTVLGFAPGTGWVLDVVEREVGKPLPEAKLLRAAAERARRKSSIQARSRFEKACGELGAKLRVLDIDRLFIDAALAEIQRVGRATRGLPFEGAVSFSTSTKAFADYVKTVAGKAIRLKAAKNEFVKANLRLVVSIARRFNHGRLPVHMIDAYHRIAKSQRELQSKLERPPTTAEIAAATGIEAEKLEKMKTFLSETPVSLDRPISDEDGRRLIDVLVDPNEGPAVPEQMVSTETQSEMLKLLSGLKPIEADILRKRFGLVNDRERTHKEIGDEYRLSRERVRQLQEQALGKMRRAMSKRESL